MLEPGDKVFLGNGHPWSGRAGTVIGWEYLGLLGYEAPKIKLDNGMECFATKPEHVVSVVKGSK